MLASLARAAMPCVHPVSREAVPARARVIAHPVTPGTRPDPPGARGCQTSASWVFPLIRPSLLLPYNKCYIPSPTSSLSKFYKNYLLSINFSTTFNKLQHLIFLAARLRRNSVIRKSSVILLLRRLNVCIS